MTRTAKGDIVPLTMKHRSSVRRGVGALRGPLSGLLCLLALASCGNSSDSLSWDWSLVRNDQGAGQIVASGTFTTSPAPDAEGFYAITSIAGRRLGVSITSLHPAGTAIPDNEAYPVDDRVRPPHPEGQLTKAGFGYGLADGSFENPFLATWELPAVVYLAFRSSPPFGATPPNTDETTVVFHATIR